LNYYQILGIDPSAKLDEIHKAFRKKAMTTHPDVNKSLNAETEFNQLYQAYNVLKDSAKRLRYDTSLKSTNPSNIYFEDEVDFDQMSSREKDEYRRKQRAKDEGNFYHNFIKEEHLRKRRAEKINLEQMAIKHTGFKVIVVLFTFMLLILGFCCLLWGYNQLNSAEINGKATISALFLGIGLVILISSIKRFYQYLKIWTNNS